MNAKRRAPNKLHARVASRVSLSRWHWPSSLDPVLPGSRHHPLDSYFEVVEQHGPYPEPRREVKEALQKKNLVRAVLAEHLAWIIKWRKRPTKKTTKLEQSATSTKAFLSHGFGILPGGLAGSVQKRLTRKSGIERERGRYLARFGDIWGVYRDKLLYGI